MYFGIYFLWSQYFAKGESSPFKYNKIPGSAKVDKFNRMSVYLKIFGKEKVARKNICLKHYLCFSVFGLTRAHYIKEFKRVLNHVFASCSNVIRPIDFFRHLLNVYHTFLRLVSTWSISQRKRTASNKQANSRYPT